MSDCRYCAKRAKLGIAGPCPACAPRAPRPAAPRNRKSTRGLAPYQRSPNGSRRDVEVGFRAWGHEVVAWRALAARRGLRLSGLIRETMNALAGVRP